MARQSSSTEPMDITLETCTALKACHCNEETPWPPRPDSLSDSNALPACTR